MNKKKEEKMTPEQFVFWLQGYIELENPQTMSKKQVQVIKDHLKLVFKKKTPDRNKQKVGNFEKEIEKILKQEIRRNQPRHNRLIC